MFFFFFLKVNFLTRNKKNGTLFSFSGTVCIKFCQSFHLFFLWISALLKIEYTHTTERRKTQKNKHIRLRKTKNII
jgi:hypothetical protein